MSEQRAIDDRAADAAVDAGSESVTEDAPAAAESPGRARVTNDTAEISDTLLSAGKAAFTKGMCAKCHKESGEGGSRAPNLTDDVWQHCDGTIAGIESVLRSGVPREKLIDQNREFAMNPATNLVPNDDEIAALAAYVWSLSRD